MISVSEFPFHNRQNTVEWPENVFYCLNIYLANFLKTNLTKFAVIWVRKRQKVHFLRPRSSKIIVTKEKERRKRKSEEKERRRRKKISGCTLSFYDGYFGDFLAEKNCWTQKVHFTINWTGSVSASNEKVNLLKGLFKALKKVQREKKRW